MTLRAPPLCWGLTIRPCARSGQLVGPTWPAKHRSTSAPTCAHNIVASPTQIMCKMFFCMSRDKKCRPLAIGAYPPTSVPNRSEDIQPAGLDHERSHRHRVATVARRMLASNRSVCNSEDIGCLPDTPVLPALSTLSSPILQTRVSDRQCILEDALPRKGRPPHCRLTLSAELNVPTQFSAAVQRSFAIHSAPDDKSATSPRENNKNPRTAGTNTSQPKRQ